MIIHTAHKVKLYTGIREAALFKETVAVYRRAVDYLIGVYLDCWNDISAISSELERKTYVGNLLHHIPCIFCFYAYI